MFYSFQGNSTKEYTIQIKELSLRHKTKLSIPISLQPDGVDLWYFKLRLFGLKEFKVRNIRVCGKDLIPLLCAFGAHGMPYKI